MNEPAARRTHCSGSPIRGHQTKKSHSPASSVGHPEQQPGSKKQALKESHLFEVYLAK
ncbi:AAEL006030-PA [Aedes aegypti]|uniref:AAEL006030-PA n=1 Tax=Aedes aegypti TaxID=7159 RepID=Q177T9_AEDAE|nr:AAEL006030-PA [Aedes aegypti]